MAKAVVVGEVGKLTMVNWLHHPEVVREAVEFQLKWDMARHRHPHRQSLEGGRFSPHLLYVLAVTAPQLWSSWICSETDFLRNSFASRIVNLVVGAITVLGGIAQIFGFSLQTIVVGVYMIVFGLAIALLEFQIPPQMSRYTSFLFSFIGRGAFYIFVGCLLLGKMLLQNIAGGIVGIVGVAYVALAFIPSIEPPTNMRKADNSGWAADQV